MSEHTAEKDAPSEHDFLPVAGHPDDDECTHRSDGTDATYCGEPRAWHDHHPDCYQSTGDIPDDLPDDLCDCRVLHALRRYENARDKHTRAVQRLQGRPEDERLQATENALRLEMLWAREEMARKIAMWAWNEAHDAFCDFGIDCSLHVNPYVRKDPGTGGVS